MHPNLEPLPGITLLGLGPGSPDLLTRQAWQVLAASSEIYLRTSHHPVVKELPSHLQVHSFDDLYERKETFEEVYRQIVEQILDLGRRPQGVIYAVPGHPFVAETTCLEIARRAAAGLEVKIVEGLSFLEPVFRALDLDPFPHISLVDALELGQAHVPPFPTSAPALIAQIYSPAVASEVKLTLLAFYPDEHPVRLVHAAGTPQEKVESLPLYEIDRQKEIGLLSVLFVPPLGIGTAFEDFAEIIAHLRAPNGCPWDREQTHLSLRPYLLEETYEVLDALDRQDQKDLQEELGDLLLQIVLHSQIASETGEFGMPDVIQGIHSKIVRRHPHVFGDQEVKTAQGVLLSWERLKSEERLDNGKPEAGVLDSIARALPAVLQAEQYQKRVARLGFDALDNAGVKAKAEKALHELTLGPDEPESTAQIGELLFALVNLARRLGVEPESALREANLRFFQRFTAIEQAARLQGKALSELAKSESPALWLMDRPNE